MADKVMTVGVKMKMMMVIMATMMVTTITAPMHVPDTALSTLRHNHSARQVQILLNPFYRQRN